MTMRTQALFSLLQEIADIYKEDHITHSETVRKALKNALEGKVEELRDHLVWVQLTEACDVVAHFKAVSSIIDELYRDYPEIFKTPRQVEKRVTLKDVLAHPVLPTVLPSGEPTGAMADVLKKDLEYYELVTAEVKKYTDVFCNTFPVEPNGLTFFQMMDVGKLDFVTFDARDAIMELLQTQKRIHVVGYSQGNPVYARPRNAALPGPTPSLELMHTLPQEYLEFLLGFLSANKYIPITELVEVLNSKTRLYPERFLTPEVVNNGLQILLGDKRALCWVNAAGVYSWKAPKKGYKKMRRGERKTQIVQVLDRHSSPKNHLTAAEIFAYAEEYFASSLVGLKAGAHGTYGSALGALKADKKLKRFRWKYVEDKEGSCEYWTTPIVIGKK